MPTSLTGSTQAVSLGEGYSIRAVGVVGSATLQRPSTSEARSRSRGPRDGTAVLEEAFRKTGLVEVREVELDVRSSAPSTSASRAGAGDGPAMELRVPDLGPEVGQLVLACDEAGALTWHLPTDDGQRVETPATRGSGGVKRFVIPVTRPAPPSPEAAAKRSLISLAGRKLLKILVYQLADPLIGLISDVFAEKWEGRYRPYGLRTFTSDSFRKPEGVPLGAAEWTHLRGGRSLLFIHGTFSTAHSAFQLLGDDTFKRLSDRYQGRVFAFNHFTLSHDPKQNVEWLLSQLPSSASPLDVDIVCHSRGGLVARTLAEQPSAFGLDNSSLKVGRIVFVGVPNSGTMLAHPDHMVGMIDRLTSALNVFPTGMVTETLEAIITTVKVIGHGALSGLDGLASMRPGGPFLSRLNQGAPSGAGYYAISADFEPGTQGLKGLLAGSMDGIADRVFEDTGNDLVVPELGVYSANGSGAFPIPADRVLKIDPAAGVLHTTFFGHPAATAKIAEWLES